MTDKKLRTIIAQCTDEVVSARFTENQVSERTDEWIKGNKETPSTGETVSMTLSECRDFSEELLFKVLSRVLVD